MKSPTGALVFQLLLFMVAGCLRRADVVLLEYLQEENQVLREQLGGARLRFTDAQRARLGVKAHAAGRAALGQLSTIVSPETLLRWCRQLVARTPMPSPSALSAPYAANASAV